MVIQTKTKTINIAIIFAQAIMQIVIRKKHSTNVVDITSNVSVILLAQN
jgi:hypothetical protein